MAARRSLPNMTCSFLTKLWHRFIEVAGCTCLWEKGLWPACCWEQLYGLNNLLYWLIQGTGRLLAGTTIHDVVCRAPLAGRALAFEPLVHHAADCQTPASQDCQDLSKAIPLRLYGDGAEATRRQAKVSPTSNRGLTPHAPKTAKIRDIPPADGCRYWTGQHLAKPILDAWLSSLF